VTGHDSHATCHAYAIERGALRGRAWLNIGCACPCAAQHYNMPIFGAVEERCPALSQEEQQAIQMREQKRAQQAEQRRQEAQARRNQQFAMMQQMNAMNQRMHQNNMAMMQYNTARMNQSAAAYNYWS
jgi:hypothetical protein